MSHFTTIVFSKTGQDPEIRNLLAPYHEFECTGIEDQYIQEIDQTEEAKKDYLNRSSEDSDITEVDYISDYYNYRVINVGEKPDLAKEHKYGYIVKDSENNLIKVINRTNPNKKWDWYCEGGRWDGFFKPNNSNNYVNTIQKKDLDLSGMLLIVEKEANEIWDIIDSILKGRKIPQWQIILEAHSDPKDARKVYNDLEVIKDLKSHERFKNLYFSAFDDVYCISRQEYIQKQTSSIIVPFSFVDKSGWHEKGRMGWFGISTDEQEQQDWNHQFWEAYYLLNPEYYMTIIDCHI